MSRLVGDVPSISHRGPRPLAGGRFVRSGGQPCEPPRHALPAGGAAPRPVAPDLSGRSPGLFLRQRTADVRGSRFRQRSAVRAGDQPPTISRCLPGVARKSRKYLDPVSRGQSLDDRANGRIPARHWHDVGGLRHAGNSVLHSRGACRPSQRGVDSPAAVGDADARRTVAVCRPTGRQGERYPDRAHFRAAVLALAPPDSSA